MSALRALLGIMLTLLGCASGHRDAALPAAVAPVTPVGVFDVPRTRGPIVIDGHCDEGDWQTAFRSPAFLDSHRRYSPHTEFRALADDDNLYVELYAADEDLESIGDELRLDIGPLHLVLKPKSATLPTGVKLASDFDGTIDDPHNLDEEWVSELAIPWSLLGSHEVAVRAFRMDVGKNHPPHALAWPPVTPTTLRFGSPSKSPPHAN